MSQITLYWTSADSIPNPASSGKTLFVDTDGQTKTKDSFGAVTPIEVDLSDATPTNIGTAFAGTSSAVSRDDHVHAHGNLAGGSLHGVVTTTVPGFMSTSDKVDLVAVAQTTVTANQVWAGPSSGAAALPAFRALAYLDIPLPPISSTTTTTTLTTTDYTKLCDATSGAFTVNLPAAASNTGRLYNIKKTDSSANAITVDANASELIDGATTYSLLVQYESVSIQCDGTGWNVL